MKKPRRRKSTVYHVVYAEKVRMGSGGKQTIKDILKKGLLPNAPKIGRIDEKKFRKIFDGEKPKSLLQSQNNAIFFWPKVRHSEVAAGIIKTRVGKQALVADAEIFSKVINYSRRPERFQPLTR